MGRHPQGANLNAPINCVGYWKAHAEKVWEKPMDCKMETGSNVRIGIPISNHHWSHTSLHTSLHIRNYKIVITQNHHENP